MIIISFGIMLYSDLNGTSQQAMHGDQIRRHGEGLTVPLGDTRKSTSTHVDYEVSEMSRK